MEILLQLVYSGIALGMIYAVIAFGYQLTFQTSDTLNFGQGDALMLGAMVGLTLVNMGVNYWLMLPLVIAFGLLQGGFVERIGVRPAIKIKSEFGWIMSTIALGIIFKNVAENIWGRDDLKFPSPLPESPLTTKTWSRSGLGPMCASRSAGCPTGARSSSAAASGWRCTRATATRRTA